MIIDKSLEIELMGTGIYEAFQFVVNTANTVDTAKYCKDTILRLLTTMKEEHNEWKEALWSELMSQKSTIRTVSVTTDSLPSHMTSIAGEDISTRFLLNKLTKDFFQYSRNVFDSISQIANVALLGTNSRKPDSVDFPAMLKAFNQQTYSQDFPKVSAWYNAISLDPAFQYLDAFNNRTKHTCDVYLKVSLDFLGDEHSSNINPFFRKDIQHDKKDIGEYLNQIFSFVTQSFDSFMSELGTDCQQRKYLNNRYNKLKCWQQKIIDTPDSDFSVVYIEGQDDISVMPDEIYVLLLNKCEDGTIYCKNCSIDTILVEKAGSEHDFIGRYIAAEPCGDDTLLRYRKYQKDITTGMVSFIKTMAEWRETKTFYHKNPFMDMQTTSDDDTFIARVQLPF